jgi:hypothetical protein
MRGLVRELPRSMQRMQSLSRRLMATRALRAIAAICVLATLSLALGACTKCDVPLWSAPRACHDGPAQQ